MRGSVLSIKTLLISGIVGLQIVTVSAILLSSYFASEQVLLGHARQLMTNVSLETTRHAEDFLLPAKRAGDLTQRLANHKVLHTDDFRGMARYFYEQLRLNPSFSGIYFGATDGQFSFVQRDDSLVAGGYYAKTVLIQEGLRQVEVSRHDAEFIQLQWALAPDDDYDPRTRPWFRDSTGRNAQVWTDPYIFYTSQAPGISSANPVYDRDGAIIGAVGVDIGIAHLSDFLGDLKISEHALAFILNSNGDVIGFPDIDRIKKSAASPGGGLRFARIDDLGDPIARAAVGSLGRGLNGFTLEQPTLTSFDYLDRPYLATFSPVLAPHLPWTLGLYAPESDFLAALQKNQRDNALIAAAITLLACLFGFLLWRSIARPMSALRVHAMRVRDGDFESVPAIGSRYSEIRDTLASFTQMVQGLRERDLRNRELSEGLRERDAQLLQAQKMEAIGKLTGGVAHDFNNLLGVIVGNLEALRDSGGTDAEGRAMADNAIRAALRGGELTHRLLAFARKQRLAPEVVDLNALVLGTVDLLRRSLGSGITIHPEISDDLWPVRVDPAPMEVALLNLATNARDAMPHGGSLTIETANVVLDEDYTRHHEDVLPGRYAMVLVTDSGLGMAPDILEQAVQPFFTTKEIGQGSGLGLSTVYGFLKQSQGHLSITSEPGGGTTVKLCFPAVLDAVPAPPPREEPTRSLAGSGETVLVVEDDPDVRAMAIRSIADLGYAVLEAADGPAALALLREGKPARVLFTDVVLPHQMDGSQLAEEARKLRPDLKILFTSGYNETIVGNDGRLAEGVALIAKPYRQQELARRLREVLEQSGP